MPFTTKLVPGKTLTIVIDLSKDEGQSGSGKSLVIASSRGNLTLDGGIKLGLNCYRPNPR